MRRFLTATAIAIIPTCSSAMDLPTSSAVNPVLTFAAGGARVAHIKDRDLAE